MSSWRKPGARARAPQGLAIAAGGHDVTTDVRSIEDIDLADLTAALKDRFAAAAPTGYLLGRTALRDAITAMLSCSELEAEDIVETMIARGFARYDGDPEQAAGADCPWILRA